MSYIYRYASEDKWIYTGLEPVAPKLRSEEGVFTNPSLRPREPFYMKDSFIEKGIKCKRGRFGFGQKEGCPFNQFLDVHFDKGENEEGLDFGEFPLEDGDLGILVMPEQAISLPCQIESGTGGLSAVAADQIDERCFVLSEDGKLVSVSLDPTGEDRIKVLPSVSFLSWAKPTCGIEPRFAVKVDSGIVKIRDNKRGRDYFTMAQTDDHEHEGSIILRALNNHGLSAIVGQYPVRRAFDEDNRP